MITLITFSLMLLIYGIHEVAVSLSDGRQKKVKIND
jgi:hypothetical protein